MNTAVSSVQLTGGNRRRVLTLVTLFFIILYVEVHLGHQPVLEQGILNGSAVPVVLIPLALAVLVTAQLLPGRITGILLEIGMGVCLAVGIAGAVFHLGTNGVRLDHLAPVFYVDTWTGRDSPAWPIAISMAGFIGAWSGWGLARDRGFVSAELRAGGLLLGLDLLAGALLFAGVILINVPAVQGIGLALAGMSALAYTALIVGDLVS